MQGESILKKLDEAYPNAECALNHRSPWELLVATILSAQCTDARVNMVTPELFRKYPTIQDFARANQAELAADIRTTGFFNNKAKSVIGAAKKVLGDFGGEIPRDIDQLLAKNAVTRLTLSLMYATDFFDQVEHRILPALRAGTVVLADRFIFTLIARGVVRGINRDYISGLYAMALRPHLTFWLNVRPETAFAREFKKAQAISYWEAGRDMSLSHDLYWSFIRYQTMIKREFEVMAKRHNFIELDGEASVSAVNKQLRQRIGERLGIRATKYAPSSALQHLWR